VSLASSIGSAPFQLVGDLTVKDATRRVTWSATASFDGPRVAVQARTAFRLGDFGLQQPRVSVVLSVEDDIKLEADLSPIAAGNFVALASCGYYDGTVFHRTAALQDGTPFVIQGGQNGDGPGYTIQDEKVTATYQRGTVAMARTGDPHSTSISPFITIQWPGKVQRYG
jgi:hypothetical protein